MGHRSYPVVILTAVLLLPLVAADDGPKGVKARAAIKKYERSVERANADRDRVVAAAAKELRAELDVALKAAMKAGSLDEANSIKAASKSLMAPATGPEEARSDVAAFVGTWNIVYANQTRRTYTIDDRGRLAWGDRRTQLVSTPNGIASPIRFEQGKRERYTPLADGRLLVEHFAPDSAFPDGTPDQLGVAVPAKRRVTTD